MSGKLVRVLAKRGQRGMTTAEYAVGSVAVATGVGVVTTMFQQDWFMDLLKFLIKVLSGAIGTFFGVR